MVRQKWCTSARCHTRSATVHPGHDATGRVEPGGLARVGERQRRHVRARPAVEVRSIRVDATDGCHSDGMDRGQLAPLGHRQRRPGRPAAPARTRDRRRRRDGPATPSDDLRRASPTRRSRRPAVAGTVDVVVAPTQPAQVVGVVRQAQVRGHVTGGRSSRALAGSVSNTTACSGASSASGPSASRATAVCSTGTKYGCAPRPRSAASCSIFGPERGQHALRRRRSARAAKYMPRSIASR